MTLDQASDYTEQAWQQKLQKEKDTLPAEQCRSPLPKEKTGDYMDSTQTSPSRPNWQQSNAHLLSSPEPRTPSPLVIEEVELVSHSGVGWVVMMQKCVISDVRPVSRLTPVQTIQARPPECRLGSYHIILYSKKESIRKIVTLDLSFSLHLHSSATMTFHSCSDHVSACIPTSAKNILVICTQPRNIALVVVCS